MKPACTTVPAHHSRVYSGPTDALSDYNATYPSDDRFLGAKNHPQHAGRPQ